MNLIYNLINQWCNKHRDINTFLTDIPSKVDGANYKYPAVILEYPFRYSFSMDRGGYLYQFNIMFQVNVNEFTATVRSHQPYYEFDDEHIIAQDYLRYLLQQLFSFIESADSSAGFFTVSNISCMGYTHHNDDSIECLRASFNLQSTEPIDVCVDDANYDPDKVLESPLGVLIPKSFNSAN